MDTLNELLQIDAIYSLAVIIAALVVGMIISAVVAFLLKRLDKKVLFGKLTIRPVPLNTPLRSLIPAICLLAVLPMLRLTTGEQIFVAGFVRVWLMASIGWLLIQIVNDREKAERRIALHQHGSGHPRFVPRRSLYQFAQFLLGFLQVCSSRT